MTPANPDALADALARSLIEDKFAATLALRRSEAFKAARLLIAGPLAPLLADLQRVTAERDDARKEASDLQNDWADQVAASRQEIERADIAEASLVTAEARAAQLQAEVEAKDRRIAELTETWTDEGGTVWSPPTAWAYAKACAALHKHQADAEALRAALKPFADAAGLFGPPAAGREYTVVDAKHLRAARAATAREG